MHRLNKFTYILLYLMLLSPILSYFTMEGFGFPVTKVFSYLIAIYGVMFFISARKRIVFPKAAWFLLFFIAFIEIQMQTPIVSFIYKAFKGIVLFNGSGLFRGQHFSVLIMIIIIYNTNFTDRFIRRCITIIKITVIMAAIVSVIQIFNTDFLNAYSYYTGGVDLSETYTTYQYRRWSIFGYIDSNEIGLSYMPLLSVIIGYLLYNRTRSYKYFLILGGISALLTNGRYVIIAFIIITVQIIFVEKERIKGIFKYALFAIIGFFLLYQLLTFYGYDLQKWMDERLFAEGSIYETSRYKAIGTFLMFFPQTPLFGTGGMTNEIREASNAVGSSQIHVGYLAGLVYYGIVGGFFLFGFWFLLAKKFYKTAKITGYWGSFFGFLTFLWANAALVYFQLFFYGIFFAMVFDKYYSDKYASDSLVYKSKLPNDSVVSTRPQ
jgi:hypothetical protein